MVQYVKCSLFVKCEMRDMRDVRAMHVMHIMKCIK